MSNGPLHTPSIGLLHTPLCTPPACPPSAPAGPVQPSLTDSVTMRISQAGVIPGEEVELELEDEIDGDMVTTLV